MCTILQSVQSDLATFGGWCFLAGVFLMVTGDGLTNFNEPDVASAWPWMYLVPLGVSFVLMAVAGRVDPRRPSRAAVVYAPLAALLGAFALSAIFSQERALSGEAFAGLIAIAVFWWYAGQVLEDRRLADQNAGDERAEHRVHADQVRDQRHDAHDDEDSGDDGEFADQIVVDPADGEIDQPAADGEAPADSRAGFAQCEARGMLSRSLAESGRPQVLQLLVAQSVDRFLTRVLV